MSFFVPWYDDTESKKRWIRKYRYGRKAYDKEFMRKRRFRKPGPKAKDYKNAVQAWQIKKLKNDVYKLKKGSLGKEWKTHDKTQAAVVISNAGTLYSLTEIAQGDRSLDREGLVINIQSLWLKILLSSSTAHAASHEIRLIIFRDNGNENGGTVPTIAGDLLEAAGVLDFTDHQTKSRYKILYDKFIIINPSQSTVQKTILKKYYKKFNRPKKCFYTNTTAADEGKGQLYLMAMSNTATNQPTIAFRSRVKFTD